MNDGRLLLITPDFPPHEGGVAHYLAALANHLKDRIEVLTSPHPTWQTFDPSVEYPIYRSNLLYRYFWPHWIKTVKYLLVYHHRYQLILTSHLLPFGTAAWFAKKWTKVPYVVFVHGMDVRLAAASSRKRTLARKILQGAKLVVANSESLAKELAQMFRIREILVVYPCMDSSFLTSPTISSTRPRPFTLITVSRLVERKGHVRVLNALTHLKRSGQLDVFQYHIVGEGPMASSLRGMVETLGLEHEVIFHGRASNAQRDELYRASDLFIMPVSQDPVDKEGFGLAYIEAAAAGLPSIATRIEGVDEAVIDKETGILLDTPDEQLLASTILMFSRDPELRRTYGTMAQEHAKKFMCNNQMSKLDAYL